MSANQPKLCPACTRPLDPLRAPVVRIVGGKVIAFCSNECARGEPRPADPSSAQPSAMSPPVPAAAMSGAPIGEIRPEPSRPAPAPILASADVADVAPRRSRKRVWLAAAGTLVAAGIGGAVVQMVGPGRSAPAGAVPAVTAPVTPAVAAGPAAPAAPAVPDEATLLAQANKTLEDYLRDGSPRVRRMAAEALSRTGHQGAVDELVKQLDAETGAITRLDIAYALARAGHPRGKEVLVAALGEAKRDTRFTAARHLARLGDDRGKGQLKSALSLTTHRLSAAEALAWLGDAEAVKVLKEALGGKEAEPRMRAATALAHVGDAAGAEVLKAMLADDHYALGAADALAWLGDTAAVPVLTRALAHSALCRDAALSLRKLGAKPELAPLASALASADEVGKIAAAEAVIVLLDPAVPVELAPRPEAPQ